MEEANLPGMSTRVYVENGSLGSINVNTALFVLSGMVMYYMDVGWFLQWEKNHAGGYTVLIEDPCRSQ